jgi:hypothetical protein
MSLQLDKLTLVLTSKHHGRGQQQSSVPALLEISQTLIQGKADSFISIKLQRKNGHDTFKI